MVDGEIDLDDEAPESGKKKRKLPKLPKMPKLPKLSVKWIAIILGAITALLILAGAAWYFLGYEEAPPEEEFTEEGELLPVEIPYDFEEIYAMEPFRDISLKGPGKVKLLNVTMELEMEDTTLRDELSLSAPSLREVIIPVLKARPINEIRGADGKILLKNRLIKKINKSLTTGRIRNIYFTEFVVYFEQ